MSKFISKLSLATLLIGATFTASNPVYGNYDTCVAKYSIKDLKGTLSHMVNQKKEACKKTANAVMKSAHSVTCSDSDKKDLFDTCLKTYSTRDLEGTLNHLCDQATEKERQTLADKIMEQAQASNCSNSSK